MNTQQLTIIEQVLFAIKLTASQGRRPLVLLDIDDTLLLTAWRHVRILKEFSAHPEITRRFNGELPRLAQIEPQQTHYFIKKTAQAAGVRDESLLSELEKFWFDRFFKNDYLTEDRALTGATKFCQDLLASGGGMIYLTGRDETMREGTLSGLLRNGFPAPNEQSVRLILKPRFEMPDLEFKTNALENISSWGEIVAGFDNEPIQVNLFHQKFPRALSVLVETRHSGKPVEVLPGIHRIPHF